MMSSRQFGKLTHRPRRLASTAFDNYTSVDRSIVLLYFGLFALHSFGDRIIN